MQFLFIQKETDFFLILKQAACSLLLTKQWVYVLIGFNYFLFHIL